MLNNSFYKFLFGFAAIIGAAFVLLYVVSSQPPAAPSVDTVAHPR